jgi:hypothetical protein
MHINYSGWQICQKPAAAHFLNVVAFGMKRTPASARFRAFDTNE